MNEENGERREDDQVEFTDRGAGEPDRERDGAEPVDETGETGDHAAESGDELGSIAVEARKLFAVAQERFVEPLLRNYPQAVEHLSAAGAELAAAYRAFVRGDERRWAGDEEERRRITVEQIDLSWHEGDRDGEEQNEGEQSADGGEAPPGHG